MEVDARYMYLLGLISPSRIMFFFLLSPQLSFYQFLPHPSLSCAFLRCCAIVQEPCQTYLLDDTPPSSSEPAKSGMVYIARHTTGNETVICEFQECESFGRWCRLMRRREGENAAAREEDDGNHCWRPSKPPLFFSTFVRPSIRFAARVPICRVMFQFVTRSSMKSPERSLRAVAIQSTSLSSSWRWKGLSSLLIPSTHPLPACRVRIPRLGM
jgi:hypothetical protein